MKIWHNRDLTKGLADARLRRRRTTMSESENFPNKKVRKVCWDARDVYWTCLDKNNSNDQKCADEMKLFKSSCPKQWVTHFIRKREYLKYKEELEKEDPIERLERVKKKLQDEKSKQ